MFTTLVSTGLTISSVYSIVGNSFYLLNSALLRRNKLITRHGLCYLEKDNAFREGFFYKLHTTHRNNYRHSAGLLSYIISIKQNRCLQYGFISKDGNGDGYCLTDNINLNIDGANHKYFYNFNKFDDYEEMCKMLNIESGKYQLHDLYMEYADMKKGDQVWMLCSKKIVDDQCRITKFDIIKSNNVIYCRDILLQKYALPLLNLNFLIVIVLFITFVYLHNN